MKKTLFGLGCALALTLAHGETHLPGATEVRALGRLNGEALACKQMALVDRIRAHIVGAAPKTREIGEIFEAATTETFIAMGSDAAACQDGRTLAERIETATQALRAAFAVGAK